MWNLFDRKKIRPQDETQVLYSPAGIATVASYLLPRACMAPNTSTGTRQKRDMSMRPTPTAIGYIRQDVSGISQAWDTAQIRKLATRFGYELADIVLVDCATPHLAETLCDIIREVDAEAVITPNLAHMDHQRPDEVLRACDVITVNPTNTYVRTALPSMWMQAE
jgi:hypothetical protein